MTLFFLNTAEDNVSSASSFNSKATLPNALCLNAVLLLFFLIIPSFKARFSFVVLPEKKLTKKGIRPTEQFSAQSQHIPVRYTLLHKTSRAIKHEKVRKI